MPRSLSRRTVFSVAALAAACALGASVPIAYAGAAPPAPTAELMVILASQTDGGTDDKELKGIEELGQRPLVFFNTRRLLQKRDPVPLVQKQPVSISVPDGPTFTVVLTDILREDKKPPRYVMASELKSSTGTSKIGINTKAGDRVFIGGPTYRGGTLFFGVRVNKDTAPAPSTSR